MGQYWLFKTEPDEYSIDDLRRDGVGRWDGIRNYQARNRLRDQVKVGDQVFIHHSSCKTPAVVGLARVCAAAYPDPSQFDPDSPYFDAKSTVDAPRWLAVDIRHEKHLPEPITLKQIKQLPVFSELELVTHPRLSIQQVSDDHARQLLLLANA